MGVTVSVRVRVRVSVRVSCRVRVRLERHGWLGLGVGVGMGLGLDSRGMPKEGFHRVTLYGRPTIIVSESLRPWQAYGLGLG